MKWEMKTLDELGDVSRGRSKHRPRNDPSLFGGEYPFIQTADVKDANFYITNYSQTYNNRGLEQSKLWQPGTLCITIAANIADTGILGIPACFPDSVMGFIPYEGVSDVKYVKYCFDILQRDCKQISQGTAQDNLSWKKLSTIKFPAPPLETQKKIVSILSSFDDLIENNQKQIKLLEEAAQRLYQEWFVKLRFPGHENVKIVDGVPEGWKRCVLDDVILFNPKVSVAKGTTKKSVPMSALSASSMIVDSTQFTLTKTNAGSKFENGDTLLARITPCLQNGKIGYVNILEPNEAAVGSTEFIVMRSKTLNPFIVYLLARSEDFRDFAIKTMTGSDGRQRAQVNKLMSYPYLLAPKRIIDCFGKYSAPIFDAIREKHLQNINLAEARDRLLPKLMSGELEV